jgi:hypothetical protein
MKNSLLSPALRRFAPALLLAATLSPAPLAAAPTITLVAGQLTDRSVTIGTHADAALEISFQYGTTSGVYTAATAAAVTPADPYASGFFASQTVISGLAADTRYYYRLQYRTAGTAGAFTAGAERTFHTMRPAGSSFVFCIQGDSHPERAKSMFDADLYVQTLTAVSKEQPDFYILSGDDFSVDTLPTPYTQPSVTGRYTLQLPWLDLVSRSSTLFLVNGNHEQASLFNYNLAPDGTSGNQVPIWAQNARNLYFPMPAPNDASTGTFYSGNANPLTGIGPLRDYYAWQNGDALFVVIDPYWSSPAQVDSGLGGQTGKTSDKWLITHGDAQYWWLKQTLEQSTAKWKFVFAHHVMGTGRGGVEIAGQYEWGGHSTDSSWGFTTRRPTWPTPLHQLMAANHVTIFFQGHDHLFAHQQLDGVVYQEVPNPADYTYTAFNAHAYTSGDVLPNAGYLRVTVASTGVKVEYVREFLPKDENASQVSGQVAFSYTVAGGAAPPPAATWILPSSARASGVGGAFYTTDLAVANTSAADAILTLKFLGHDADGTGGAEKSFTLAAGKGAIYADVLGSVFGLSSGYGAVRVASSTTTLAVSSQTSTRAPGGGTFGQSVPSFADADLIRSGSTRTILGVREDSAFRTNLILTNATSSPLDVDVSLVDSAGAVVASKRYPLLPLGMTQVTRVVRDLGIASDTAGRLVLSTPTASGAFAAYAALIDGVTNDPRTLLPR